MAKERNNIKAGAFILISAALITAVIFSIKGFGQLFAPEQRRTVSFRLTDDLGGLQVGDEVRLGGFKVGVVEGIEVRGDVREVALALPAEDGRSQADAAANTDATTQPASGPVTARASDDGATVAATASGPDEFDATRLLVTF